MLDIIIMAVAALPNLDWIEKRAALRGDWERCVYNGVLDFEKVDTHAIDNIVALAMLKCDEAKLAFADQVDQNESDKIEVAIQIAEADVAIRRWARHMAVKQRASPLSL